MRICAEPVAHGRDSVNSRNTEKKPLFFFGESTALPSKFHVSTLNKFEEH